MKELLEKYISGKLTHQDLETLRTQDQASADAELGEFMKNKWMNEDIDTSRVSDGLQDKVRMNLNRQLNPVRNKIPLYVKVLGWAAAILLPILFISTLHFYHESNNLISDEMVVTTGEGEKATISLPDGTKVTLNSESRLGYIPKTFNRETRQINFSGEGYFVVAKNKECPFMIGARGLNVKVLGTTFDLLVREKEETAQLALEEGKVWFGSLVSGKSVILLPNQKLMMDQNTGKITVFKESVENVSTWRRNEIIFRNVSLQTVLKRIEKTYNVRISIKGREDSTDLFTGTLATNDINGVLEVLEKSYHMKAIMKGKDISIIQTR